jgi:superoxide dismutase, Cu-Zn family
MNFTRSTAAGVLVLLLVALLWSINATTPASAQEATATATAEIRSINRTTMGQATFTALASGEIMVRVNVGGFDPVAGDHRVAVTEVGRCDAPEFATAGQDQVVLPIMHFYGDGSARYEAISAALTWDIIAEGNGGALVIYAGHGDDPGHRIACGVIEAATPPPPDPTPLPVVTPDVITVPPAATPAATPVVTPPVVTARAEIRNIANIVMGHATFTQEPGTGVIVHVEVHGFDPSGREHGIHIHEVGECTPPDFMSAGGHYNPTEAQHGLMNPQGPHAGDLPNIFIDHSGSATYTATTSRIILGPGAGSIFEGRGASIVIHENADDHVTDPSGRSGARIACGVITLAQE